MKYYLYSWLCLMLCWGELAYAQYQAPQVKKVSLEEKARRGDKLKAYKIRPNTGMPEQVNLTDTIALGSHNYLSPEHRSIGVAYAGNANQPWQSRLFFDRQAITPDFVALSGYQTMLYAPENALFYNTKVPLTFVHYRKNFDDNTSEEVLNGTISLNLGKAINIGISAEHNSALGHYVSNRSKNTDYRIFGSYNSDRYDLWAYVANDYYKQQENGGIADINYIENPDKYGNGRIRFSSLDIPVRINSPLFNRIRSGNAFLSHRYKLGHYKRIETTPKAISVEGVEADPSEPAPDPVVFVPVGSFSHQVSYNNSSRRMIATQHSDLWSSLWGTPVSNTQTDNNGNTQVIPNDLSSLKVLKNTLSLSLMEGFRPWVKAGLSAYLRTENYWASYQDVTSGQHSKQEQFFSMFAGGELSRMSGKGFNFVARGEIALLGKDLGGFKFEGDATTRFKLLGKHFGLKLDGQLINFRPAYFAQHNYHTWAISDNSFGFTRRLELGAKADFSSFGSWAELRTASLQNHIYWASDAKAHQHKDLIQVSMLRAGHRYQVGALAWGLEAAYQLSTAPEMLPLPALTAKADLHLDFMIAKVLQVHLGLEAYWHSRYFAPVYHPAVMQFVNQNEYEIGGRSPLVNAYANFRMRTTRFYVRMFNAGEMLLAPQRETMPHYVLNPPHLEAGVVIDLKN